MKINHKRLLDTFLKLVKIDSESFEEKEMQEFLEVVQLQVPSAKLRGL